MNSFQKENKCKKRTSTFMRRYEKL